jgi:hypothetical protein
VAFLPPDQGLRLFTSSSMVNSMKEKIDATEINISR